MEHLGEKFLLFLDSVMPFDCQAIDIPPWTASYTSGFDLEGWPLPTAICGTLSFCAVIPDAMATLTGLAGVLSLESSEQKNSINMLGTKSFGGPP